MQAMQLREMLHADEKHTLDDTLINDLNHFGGLVAETLTGDLEHEVSPEAMM